MKADIRTRMMIRFTLIVSVILFVLCSCIYWFSANYRKSEFYSRLGNKALTTVRLLTDVKEVDSTLLRIIDKNSPQLLYHEAVVVYDYKDTKIYCSQNEDSLTLPKQLLDRIRLAKQVRFLRGKDEALGLLYAEGPQRYVVMASAYDLYGKRKMIYLQWILLVGFVISIVLTVISGRYNADSSLRPISDIVKQVDKITAESLNVRVDEGNRTDEIARLSMTFNRMLDRLESAFAMQQSFVTSASHELRTPLTSVTGQIEVALMKPRDREEYVTILQSVLEDIRNLNSLSNGLLDLAKATSDMAAVTLQPVRIDEIIWETRTELTSREPGYNVNIHFDEPIEEEKELTLNGNIQLLKSAIFNLMENGCKFSTDHTMEIHLYTTQGHIRLEFADRGIGISAEDRENILQPFFRAGNVESIPGSGLGLPLAFQIIRLHGGTLAIDSLPGKGTTVTVTLPVMT